MFKFFFYGLLGITALMIYSWVSIFFLPAGARDASLSNKMNTGGITLLFGAASLLAWYFQKIENQRAANFTVYGFYGLLLVILVWAMWHGKWN